MIRWPLYGVLAAVGFAIGCELIVAGCWRLPVRG